MLFVARNRSACRDLTLPIFRVQMHQLQWVDLKPASVSIQMGLGHKGWRHLM